MLYKKNLKAFFIKKSIEYLRIWIINIAFIYLLIIRKSPTGRQSNNILLINTGDLGDNILTFKFLKNLSNSDLFDEIHVLIKDSNEEVYSCETLKIKLILWNKSKYKINPLYRSSFINTLSDEHYLVAFNITPERGLLNETLTLLSNAKSYWLIDKRDMYIRKLFKHHLNSFYQRIFKPNAINEYDVLDRISSELKVIDYEKSTGRSLMTNTVKMITMAPLTSDHKRNWPFENYRIIIKSLSKNYRISLLGSASQKNLIETLCENTNISNFCGKISLAEVSETINRSDLFIGNDSGLTHLAIFVNTPLIAITGGGMFNRFFPYKESSKCVYLSHKMSCFGCRWMCVYKERYCLTLVTPFEVLTAIHKILEINNAHKINHC